jgi:branched-chain amino acid transport system ATP-binding protein
MPKAMLSVAGLVAGYGKRQVLKGVDLNVAPGEIVAIIGHNGAGKSTLLKAIFGLVSIWQGRVIVDGRVFDSPSPQKLLKAGVAYVPQGNRVFADLTVRQNLELGGITLQSKALVLEGIERTVSLFPALRFRLKQRAGVLSGGEKQMLALGNALVLSPRILLVDEPSLGLAPQLVGDALAQIQEMSRTLGVTVLIVEQKVRDVLTIAQRVYVLRNGSISFSGPPLELTDDKKLREVYL